MSRKSPEEFAQLGMNYIKEAILEILMESKLRGELIGAKEITLQTGLPEGIPGQDRNEGRICFAFLSILVAENRVIQHRGGYELTAEEALARRDKSGETLPNPN